MRPVAANAAHLRRGQRGRPLNSVVRRHRTTMKLRAIVIAAALSSTPVVAWEKHEAHLGSWKYRGPDGELWVSLKPHGECVVIATLAHTIARVVNCGYTFDESGVTINWRRTENGVAPAPSRLIPTANWEQLRVEEEPRRLLMRTWPLPADRR